MLYGLIMQRPKVDFKINVWHIAFRMLVLTILLVVFVWCPPVFGFGVPANFETGDPLNPIDWSKLDLDCVKSVVPFFGSPEVNKKRAYLNKRLISLPRQSLKWTTLDIVFVGIYIALLLFVVVYIYWVHPEWVERAYDFAQTMYNDLFSVILKVGSFIYRAISSIICRFIEILKPRRAWCQGTDSDSSQKTSSTNKSASWFSGWGFYSKGETSSSTKSDDFIGTMANKAKNTSDQCDQKLKETLYDVDKQPFTPRRDAMRKDHAWALHTECKKKVGAYFEALQELGHHYSKKEQSQQTPSAYSGSYDMKNKKIEVKYESGK
jgi:hypothetical protein